MQEAAFQRWIKAKCIALTGGIATGKSTVAGIIKDLGFLVIDADKLSRDIMIPGKPAFVDIVNTFGENIVSPFGTIDRKKLGSIVFSDPGARTKLELITHNRIKEEFFAQAVAQKQTVGSNYFFYEAALIFEVGRSQEFFKIICTWCPEDVQLTRLSTRNNITISAAKAIIASQMSASQKRDQADVAIDTNCSFEELKFRVSQAIDF